jgi:Na+-translocating ferredoxin:NAD+ oxidoreductase subunit C
MTSPFDAGQPCIRCGDCATACPVQLHPQHLLLQLRDGRLLEAERGGALTCIECGRCDIVCPSRIPLLQKYREVKQAIGAAMERRELALAARERYRARQLRLGRDEEQRVERIERNASLSSADAVAAAIARAQAKRAAARQDPDK